MTITTIDMGPVVGQTPAQALIRREVGLYFARLMRYDLDPAVADWIMGTAATWAENQVVDPNLPSRLQPLATAKRWIDGYLEWYDAAPTHLRNNVANQPNGQNVTDAGRLSYARRVYRNIPWTLVMIGDPNSLWNCRAIGDTYPRDVLGRIDMNMMGETINTWQRVRLGTVDCDMPLRVTKGGSTLELGVEIVLDWVNPPDAGHGHPMSTIRQLKAMAHPTNLRKDRDNSGTRKSYSILHGGEWIFVLDGPGQNTVITFYKKHI